MKCFRIDKQDIPACQKLPALEENETGLRTAISNLCRNNTVDVSELSQYLFPQGKRPYNIFISHSHADFQSARSLSVFLKKALGGAARPFVDGLVWHDVYNALLNMQCEYITPCTPDKNTYPLEDCNRMAANLYLILANALFNVLQRCSYFIFIKPANWQKDEHGRWITDSPWIAQELSFARFLHDPDSYGLVTETMNKQAALKFKHPIDIHWMPPLTAKSILEMKSFFQSAD